jgi:hypothetical protein
MTQKFVVVPVICNCAAVNTDCIASNDWMIANN